MHRDTQLSAASEPPKQSSASRRWNRSPFLTAEERLAKEQNSFAPYWRPDNSLRRGFLQRIAADPPTFEASKALFPFFREGSIYGVPTNHQHLYVWMTTALLAGWHFGGKYPDQALAAVEQAGEVEQSLNRLGVIKDTLQGLAPLPQHLLKLFGGVAAMAGGIHPAALAGAIHLWEFQNYGRGQGLYGGQLERFVRYFDFAVWLGWLLPARGKLPIV